MPDRDDLRGQRQPVPPFSPSNFPAGENAEFDGRTDTDVEITPPPRLTKTERDAEGMGERAEAVNSQGDNSRTERDAADLYLPEESRGQEPEEEKEPEIDFLALVREMQEQGQVYQNRVNRKAWSQSYRAFHSEHWDGSKYNRADWKYRSKMFRPKTRAAVRKDLAAVAAAMFGTVKAISCDPGNEADPEQRASAALMETLINYRTNRTNGKNAIFWPAIVLGSRQNAVITGVCLSKQSWRMSYRKAGTKAVKEAGENGFEVVTQADVWTIDEDRPDSQLIAPENFIIDPAADWIDPAQRAAYIIIKWPMQYEEIKDKQKAPVNPWHAIDETTLRTSGTDAGQQDTSAIRRAREHGLDRLEDAQTGHEFQPIWIYEVFVRKNGEDWTFYSAADRAFLTDPKPVREVYPEQSGDRPLTMGYGSFEAHRIFPMSPVESWQPMQRELNDFVNLALDAIKQNVMPVTLVKRGAQVDLDQVKKRASGSAILVNQAAGENADVSFTRPPDIPNSIQMITRELELDFDDLAGQFNGGTAENNNALARTLGGLKLVAGAANTLQEFDIRWWIMTWTEPTLSQLVRLEQYYENDPTVLGLAGQRAQLFQKHGVNEINDELIERDIPIRVSAGLGAGDPQQRLRKFADATGIAGPIVEKSPAFIRGELEIDVENVMDEVYSAAGYEDGGKRFIKKGQGQEKNPNADLEAEKIKSEIEKNKQTGRAALMTGVASLAKVALGNREMEDAQANALLDRIHEARAQGSDHAHALHDRLLSARDHGHRHGMEITQHRHERSLIDREDQHRSEDFGREDQTRQEDRAHEREARDHESGERQKDREAAERQAKAKASAKPRS